jgi:hypothetical protein
MEGKTDPYGVNKNFCFFACPVASRRLCYGAARFLGVRGLCPRLWLLNFLSKFLFTCAVPLAGKFLTCGLNLVK